MVTNIRGGDLSTGDLVCDYLQPFPALGTGYHRYTFVLYRQEAGLGFFQSDYDSTIRDFFHHKLDMREPR